MKIRKRILFSIQKFAKKLELIIRENKNSFNLNMLSFARSYVISRITIFDHF